MTISSGTLIPKSSESLTKPLRHQVALFLWILSSRHSAALQFELVLIRSFLSERFGPGLRQSAAHTMSGALLRRVALCAQNVGAMPGLRCMSSASPSSVVDQMIAHVRSQPEVTA